MYNGHGLGTNYAEDFDFNINLHSVDVDDAFHL